jgi:hypothetical protein
MKETKSQYNIHVRTFVNLVTTYRVKFKNRKTPKNLLG